MNPVAMHAVIAHTVDCTSPSPTHADTRIRHVTDFIVLDIDIAHITGADAQCAPVFIGRIIDIVVGDRQSGTYFTTVCRIIRKMSLVSGGTEAAGDNTVSGNITEKTAVDASALGSPFIINTRRAQMLETALLKVNVLGRFDGDCRCRASQPTLIIQFMIVLANH